VGVIGNTGKDIPQLFVSVDTGGTLQRISARAFMQVDTNLQGSTFGTGGYYLPPLLMKPLEGGASFNRAVWNLGDLPHGYAMVLTVRFRAVPTVIRQPHVSVKWYVSRTDHTLLRDATLLTGEIDQF
jgi:hypothetical protein